jgi:hypothetical protein
VRKQAVAGFKGEKNRQHEGQIFGEMKRKAEPSLALPLMIPNTC